ncbi:MAG: Sir2 family NAD-dependent protein deacetylase [Bacteroidota bacterium]|nr:Sir2 family NAD-dependent protein deacetylase [Bacteroidota bacterium]
MKKKLVALTGAGMSAESGIATFRGVDGLWEGHRIENVASPEGFKANPELVLDFYNQRRTNVRQAEPNRAHLALAFSYKFFDTYIITQNVDDLHERAGSDYVLHLHGKILQARSSINPELVYELKQDQQIYLGDLCEWGSQLRPNIVWFGETVSQFELATNIIADADVVLIIGTSMVVHPANILIDYAPINAEIYVINPVIPDDTRKPNINYIEKEATIGVPWVINYVAGLEQGEI